MMTQLQYHRYGGRWVISLKLWQGLEFLGALSNEMTGAFMTSKKSLQSQSIQSKWLHSEDGSNFQYHFLVLFLFSGAVEGSNCTYCTLNVRSSLCGWEMRDERWEMRDEWEGVQRKFQNGRYTHRTTDRAVESKGREGNIKSWAVREREWERDCKV